MRANNNLGQTHRPVTEKLHLRYDSDTSLRLTAAAHRQTTAYNRTVRDLWDHPGTPLQTSAAEGDVGLYTHLLAWREDTPELQLETTPSALARGGIAQARAAMAAFDESLERDTGPQPRLPARQPEVQAASRPGERSAGGRSASATTHRQSWRTASPRSTTSWRSRTFSSPT